MFGRHPLGRARLGGWLQLQPPFVPDVGISRSAPWQSPVHRALSTAISHGLPQDLSASLIARHRQGVPEAGQVAFPWARLADRSTSRPFDWQFSEALEQTSELRWRITLPTETNHAVGWRRTEPHERATVAWWRNTAITDIVTRIPWARALVRDVVTRAPWPLDRMLHPDWRIKWGQGMPPRTLVPNPTIERPVPPVDPREPVYVPPAGNRIGLHLDCLWSPTEGNRIGAHLRRIQCLRRNLVIDNEAILKRVDTNEEVACLEMQVNGDIESYTFGFSAQLPREAFELVEPTGEPVEVIATLNGAAFLLLLETWGEDAVFDPSGGRTETIRVRGRSISAELDEPYSPARSRFVETSMTMWQLMQQELPQGSGWELVAHPAWSDFTANTTTNVPANTFSYTDLSPIQAIARIASATGAVVQQVPGERKLRIVPRYVARPWEWGTTTADVEIDFGQVRAASAEFEPQPVHNGVFVAGETNGVLTECRRDGTAGSPWLDIVVDQLITDAQFGLQRGLAELGATGKRSIYRLELPVDPAAEGHIDTGQIAQVVQTASQSFNGQTIAWDLAARRSEQDGLTIWQSVTVERYRDE